MIEISTCLAYDEYLANEVVQLTDIIIYQTRCLEIY